MLLLYVLLAIRSRRDWPAHRPTFSVEYDNSLFQTRLVNRAILPVIAIMRTGRQSFCHETQTHFEIEASNSEICLESKELIVLVRQSGGRFQ